MKKVQSVSSIFVTNGSVCSRMLSLDQFGFWLPVSWWCLWLTVLSLMVVHHQPVLGFVDWARLSGSIAWSHLLLLKLQQRFGLIEGPVCTEPCLVLSLSKKTHFFSGGAACTGNSWMKMAVDKSRQTKDPQQSRDSPSLLLRSICDSSLNRQYYLEMCLHFPCRVF